MSKIRILIVEDDPIIGADLEDRLVDMGYEVLGPVDEGEAALPFFEQINSPDLILMDVQLAGEWDGVETTRRIRENHDLPVIFLTSNSDDATFRQAKSVNPQAFLSKPFRGRDLNHAIELAISTMTKKEEATRAAPDKEEETFLLDDRLFIKVNERMQRLFFEDIQWVEADDYYCKIHTSKKDFLVTKTLKKFSEELAGRSDFLRVHRSFIVNLKHVEEIGELYLHISKNKIPVSRNMREELLKTLKKI